MGEVRFTVGLSGGKSENASRKFSTALACPRSIGRRGGGEGALCAWENIDQEKHSYTTAHDTCQHMTVLIGFKIKSC